MVKSAIGYPPTSLPRASLWRQPGRRATGRARVDPGGPVPCAIEEAHSVLSHLVGDGVKSVPLTPVTADDLAVRSAALDEVGRRWIGATGFAAEPGKLALLPDAKGELVRVLVGVSADDELWALAALPDALPPGSYRLEPEPAAP